jgi:hypothetical protein
MDLLEDKRIVLTLDAGGRDFVFSAIQGGEAIAGYQAISPFSGRQIVPGVLFAPLPATQRIDA